MRHTRTAPVQRTTAPVPVPLAPACRFPSLGSRLILRAAGATGPAGHQQPQEHEPQHAAGAHAPPQHSNGSKFQSWSVSPAAGSNTWGTGRGLQQSVGQQASRAIQGGRSLANQYPLFEHGMDWHELAAAAADVARFRSQQKAKAEAAAATEDGSGGSSKGKSLRRRLRHLRDLPGWLLYRYYNWRQDTASDLLLVTGMSLLVLWSAALIKHTYIDTRPHTSQTAAAVEAAGAASAAKPGAGLPSAPPLQAEDPAAAAAATVAPAATTALGSSSSSSSGPSRFMSSLWDDIYQVSVLSFGENFPQAQSADALEEAFSVLVALIGLAGFALALALVEQIVLETNLANVSRGSRVYEWGHYLVLGWAVSQSDQEVIIKLVSQLCYASRSEGGATIVVLTQREKLEMEDLFRRTIPMSARHGSRLVFRQGSPLLPADLSSVAASHARATIIVSDKSRTRDEGDAQSLRCAILLDELDDYRGLRKGRALGHIVVETRTANAVPLLRYSCSKRVIALPTGQLNARRLSAMVKRPFVSWVTQRMWAFDSRCSVFMQPGKPHTGMLFSQVGFLYPDGIVMGVANTLSGTVTLNPPPHYRVEPADDLVLCRPTAIPAAAYSPLPGLLSIHELEALGEAELGQQAAAAAAAAQTFGAVLQPVRSLQQWISASSLPAAGSTPTAAASSSTATPAMAAAGNGAEPRDLAALQPPAETTTPSSSSSSSKGSRYPGPGVVTSVASVVSQDAALSSSDVACSGSSDWVPTTTRTPSPLDDSSSSSNGRSGHSNGHSNGHRKRAAQSEASVPVASAGPSDEYSPGASDAAAVTEPAQAQGRHMDVTAAATSLAAIAAEAEAAEAGAGRPRQPPQQGSSEVGPSSNISMADSRRPQPSATHGSSSSSSSSTSTNISSSSTSSSSSSRQLTCSSSSFSRHGLACSSAIMSAEEEPSALWAQPVRAPVNDTMAEEEDDVIEDDVILQEGGVAGQDSTALASSSSSSEALPLSYQETTWPSAGSVDANMLSGGGGAASGSYTRASRSSLESTMDSIDAVPGYGRRTHKTALHLHHPYASSSSTSSYNSSSSSSVRPPGSCDGLSSGNIVHPDEVDTGPYAKYHAAQHQQQQQQQQRQQQLSQQQQLQEQQQWQPSSLSSGNFTEDDHHQQQQQQPLSAEGVAGVGFMVSGWSSLDTLDTLDSMDALPGYGSLPHSTTLGTADSLSSSSGMPGSIDSSAAAAVKHHDTAGTGDNVYGTTSAAVHDALGNSNNGFVVAATAAAAEAATAAAGAEAAGVTPLSGRISPYGGFTPIGASPALGSVLDDMTPLSEVAGVLARSPSSVGPDTYPSHSSFNYVPQEYLCVDCSPEAVLVAGWSDPGFMGQLLWELDQGQSALPPGSEIVFVNPHQPDDTLGRVLQGKRLDNLKVSHVMLDPLRRDQLAVLPLHRFRAAIVLADDDGWGTNSEGTDDRQPDQRASTDVIDQPSVLRQDALMVMVQLNIRKLLEEAGLPPINIICQKVANQGLTRFEDRRRLPLGISVNFNSMAAKLLTQVAVNPMNLPVLAKLGGAVEYGIVDASEYCRRDEAISFWVVVSRAQAAGHVLMGYYVLPSHIDQPIESTINPQGLAVRSKKRVWNNGDGRLKFLIIKDKARARC